MRKKTHDCSSIRENGKLAVVMVISLYVFKTSSITCNAEKNKKKGSVKIAMFHWTERSEEAPDRKKPRLRTEKFVLKGRSRPLMEVESSTIIGDLFPPSLVYQNSHVTRMLAEASGMTS